MSPSSKCLYRGCLKRSTYGIEASRRRECCKEHALPGMVNIDLTRCAKKDCDTRASFGDPNTGRRTFCSKHARRGMRNIERKICARDGCMMPPVYWHPHNRKRRCCVEHMEGGMVKLDKKLCPVKDCFTSASYGVAGEKRKYCAAHAQEGMVSIGGRRCSNSACNKRANYGVLGSRKREYCAEHADSGMVNINHKPAPATTGSLTMFTSSASELVTYKHYHNREVRLGLERPSSALDVRGAREVDDVDSNSSDASSSDTFSDCQIIDRFDLSSGDHYATATAAVRKGRGRPALVDPTSSEGRRTTTTGSSWSGSGSGTGSGFTGSGSGVDTGECGEEGFAAVRTAVVPRVREGHAGIHRAMAAGARSSTAGGASAGMPRNYHRPVEGTVARATDSQHETKKANKGWRMMQPWPRCKNSPHPLLFTSSGGWSTYHWPPVMMNYSIPSAWDS